MSEELPKRIFKEGEETQVTQINNNCRIDYIMRKLVEWLPKELEVVKKDRVFNQIFMLHENGLGFSARVIHSFLCRELVTFKRHELWFLFARRPLRFSLQEFHAITGLQCDTLEEFNDWDDDGGFWSKVLRMKQGITIWNLWNKHRDAVKKWRNADNAGNHWIAVCVNIIEKKVECYDCGGNKNRQYVERFAAMIPRIVKAVAPPERQKPLLLSAYSIVDVPMKKRLNKTCCDCGAYALKHLECLLLGLDISLVDDEIIMGCRQKLGVDLWLAAQDPIYAEAMKHYVPAAWERCGTYDLCD